MVANSILTQNAQVTFAPTVVALSSDVTTIPPGGVANLTATLTFNGQTVAGHRLRWRIASIWDDSGNAVYGMARAEYGHLSGESATSDASGNGTAVWTAGYKKGKVKIQVSDKSVRMAPGGTNPQNTVNFYEKKRELKIQLIVGKDTVDLDNNNRKFLVGEQASLVLSSTMNITEYQWEAEGNVFEKYALNEGEVSKEGKPVRQPKGAGGSLHLLRRQIYIISLAAFPPCPESAANIPAAAVLGLRRPPWRAWRDRTVACASPPPSRRRRPAFRACSWPW